MPSVKGRIVVSALQAMGALLQLLDSAQYHKSRLDTNEHIRSVYDCVLKFSSENRYQGRFDLQVLVC